MASCGQDLAGKRFIIGLGIIDALDVDRRLDPIDDIYRVGRVRHEGVIDAIERLQSFDALVCGVDRTAQPLAYMGVRGDGNDEPVPLRAGLLQMADVPEMQDIKAAVGEDELFRGDDAEVTVHQATHRLIADSNFAGYAVGNPCAGDGINACRNRAASWGSIP